MKVLLKNCRVYDGTGTDAFSGDILIQDDRILDVWSQIKAEDAEVIDLGGKSVSPGFIDAH